MVSYLWDILIYGIELTAYTVAFLAFLASAWVIYSISFYFDGAIIAIVDDWYRNPDKDVANVRKDDGVLVLIPNNMLIGSKIYVIKRST